MKKHLLAFSFLFCTISSFGAGYLINLEGLRQVAMGGTGTAWPWDASTIFYNPGGLVRLKSIQAYASMSMIIPRTAFGDPNGSAVSHKQTFTPFNFYFGGPVKEDSRWALGLGVYTPAGNGLQWDDNWVGKYVVQNTQLKCFFIQPTVSFRVTDFLAVGAGFVYGNGYIDMSQALPVQDLNGNDGQLKMHGNAVGIGFNTGIQLKFSDRVQMGFTYRSQVNMNVDGGSAKFSVPSSLASSFPNTSFSTQLPVPQVASFGLGVRPIDGLTLQFDLNYTGWNSYDSLRIDFGQNTAFLKNNHAPRHYQNTLSPRFGANVKISKVVSVMGGFAYDPTPVTNGYVSPDLPDANRVVLSCGVTVKPAHRITLIAAFESTTTMKRAGSYDFGNFSGTYQTMAVTPGIGLYYNL